MSLRRQAEIDARRILTNPEEFGWPITVRDPYGQQADLTGFATDIHTSIDPETGQAVSDRRASIALSLASLSEAGLGIPVAVPESSRKPWLVMFDDINGHSHTFKVSEAMPDRAIGIVTCMLETYRLIGT